MLNCETIKDPVYFFTVKQAGEEKKRKILFERTGERGRILIRTEKKGRLLLEQRFKKKNGRKCCERETKAGKVLA